MAADGELRDKAQKAGRELRDAGQVIARSPGLIKAAELGIRFLLGAALAGGKVLGDAAPFGVAFVGASGAGSGGLAALLGAAMGYLLCRGLESGLRYVAACVLVFSVAFAFYDVKLYRKGWFMPLAAAAVNGAAGWVVQPVGRWSAAALAALLGEMALTAAGTYFFRLAFQSWEQTPKSQQAVFRQKVSLLMLGVATLISLADLRILGILSVGRLGAVYVLLAAARSGGVGAGTTAGVAVGLAMDLCAGGGAFYTMSYGFTGLLCGLLRGRRKTVLAAAGALGPMLVLVWTWGQSGSWAVLYEAAAAALLFLVTPQSLLEKAEGLFTRDSAAKRESWAAEEAMEKLKATAGAFGQLFAALRGAFSKQEDGEDASVIFDRAANRVCAGCPMRERCWQTGYTETYNCLNDALPHLLEEGRGEAQHFPQRFRDRCARFPAFLRAVNDELGAYLTRLRYQARLGEGRRAACRQYGDVAQVLEDAAQAMAATAQAPTEVWAAPEALTATAGVAGRNKEGQNVSGDAAGWFKDDKGTLCLILCDGMGSGPEARQESQLTLGLLERFLRAGVRPRLALRTLNEALSLRGEETGGFSTVDLLTLDLHNGKAVLYKLGAAPSYLKRGGCVTRLTGDALPAGLLAGDRSEPDQRAFQMGPGDALAMVTDGVLSQGDEWVRDALLGQEDESAKALAEILVAHGADGQDDRTAVVVRVGLRG